MTIETRPLAEITRDALRVLYKEIGIVNTVRFISQFTTGHGNYTKERKQLFAGMTLDDIISEIKQSRSQSPLIVSDNKAKASKHRENGVLIDVPVLLQERKMPRKAA